MTTTTSTKPLHPRRSRPLPRIWTAGLRRLKLATVRRTAPEVLAPAKTQRWTPEELLRTLVEAEISARDASNTANRLKAAAFPVIKTLEGFDVPPRPSRPPPSTTWLTWNGFGHNIIWPLLVHRVPARATS